MVTNDGIDLRNSQSLYEASFPCEVQPITTGLLTSPFALMLSGSVTLTYWIFLPAAIAANADVKPSGVG